VLSIQTGINEPRYVGMRGIRQMASVPIPSFGAADLALTPEMAGVGAAKVKRLNYFAPPAGKGADMLRGSREDIAARLVEMLKAKGGLN
jgi:electron transfer flavoprotein beta subunit